MIQSKTQSRQSICVAWTLEHLLIKRSITLGFALDCSTQSTYSSALNSYFTFCNLHHLDPYPTADTLSFYITFMSHHIEPHSVHTYLAGIVSELEPFYPSIHETRQSLLVTCTLRGSLHHFFLPIQQKAPLMKDDLLMVLHHVPSPFQHDDLLFLSLLFTGFFSLLCLGELIQSDNQTLRASARLSWRHTVRLEVNLYRFTIPHSKTDSLFEGNEIVIQKCATEPDPFILFQRYLNSRDMSFPFFPSLWLCSDDLVPTHSWFLHKLYLFFPRSISGHSMRAGDATSLAAAGVPPSQIQAIRCWKSDTFEQYIQHYSTLLQAVLFHGRSVHEPPFAVPP